MARRLKALVACLVAAIAFPSIAAAQSSFTGVVKDSSGGVLPGVTVEASSPVLIEGAKSDVTNSNGQYRIIDLRPGVYTVTFTLPGFKTTRQEGRTARRLHGHAERQPRGGCPRRSHHRHGQFAHG